MITLFRCCVLDHVLGVSFAEVKPPDLLKGDHAQKYLCMCKQMRKSRFTSGSEADFLNKGSCVWLQDEEDV